MIHLLIAALSLSSLTSASHTGLLYVNDPRGEATSSIAYFRLRKELLIQTSDNNYALSLPKLDDQVWQSVSVNGNEVYIYTQTCQKIKKTLSDLDGLELARLNNAKFNLLELEMDEAPKHELNVVYFDGAFSSRVLKDSGQSASYSRAGVISIERLDAHDYSVFLQAFAGRLERAFLVGEHVGLVYSNKRVMLKPLDCLNPNERKLFHQFALTVSAAEEGFKRYEAEKEKLSKLEQPAGQDVASRGSQMLMLDAILDESLHELNHRFGQETKDLLSNLD